jgi:hypothetical protein
VVRLPDAPAAGREVSSTVRAPRETARSSARRNAKDGQRKDSDDGTVGGAGPEQRRCLLIQVAGSLAPVFLKPGDELRLTIEGLGEQRQKVVACRGRE